MSPYRLDPEEPSLPRWPLLRAVFQSRRALQWTVAVAFLLMASALSWRVAQTPVADGCYVEAIGGYVQLKARRRWTLDGEVVLRRTVAEALQDAQLLGCSVRP